MPLHISDAKSNNRWWRTNEMHWFISPLCDSCTYDKSSDQTCGLFNCFIQIVFNSVTIQCCQMTLNIVKLMQLS